MTTQLVDVVAVERDGAACGCVTWWALAGLVDMARMLDACDASGFDIQLLPDLPTVETAAYRAALECQDKRTLVRPLNRRGMWEIRSEQVVTDDPSAPTLAHGFECRVEVRLDKSLLVTPGDHPFAAKIQAAFQVGRVSLAPSDVSGWLTAMVVRAKGVGLRERGGMYFVPATDLPFWRSIAGLLAACSDCKVYEMPALKSDQAVEAVLVAVRAEAEARLVEMEAYLARPADQISTRGLNAYSRACAEVRAKLEHYAQLLGAALPDVVARAETLAGAIGAAYLVGKGSSVSE